MSEAKPVTEQPKVLNIPAEMLPGGTGRQWEKPLFVGCSGCTGCCHDYYCCCCMACDVAHSLGEYCCVHCCAGLPALRTKARLAMGVKGSISGDYVLTTASMVTTNSCLANPLGLTTFPCATFPVCGACPVAFSPSSLDFWVVSQMWHEMKQAGMLVPRDSCECPSSCEKECLCV